MKTIRTRKTLFAIPTAAFPGIWEIIPGLIE